MRVVPGSFHCRDGASRDDGDGRRRTGRDLVGRKPEGPFGGQAPGLPPQLWLKKPSVERLPAAPSTTV